MSILRAFLFWFCMQVAWCLAEAARQWCREYMPWEPLEQDREKGTMHLPLEKVTDAQLLRHCERLVEEMRQEYARKKQP